MQELLAYISSHFLESLIIILLTALFFKDAITNIVLTYIKGQHPTVVREKREEKVAADVSHLRLHYNDELSEKLTKLEGLQSEGIDILRDIQRNGVRIRG